MRIALFIEKSQEAQLPQTQHASNIVQCNRHLDMLNRLGVDHECDKQTNGQTDRLKPYSADKPI